MLRKDEYMNKIFYRFYQVFRLLFPWWRVFTRPMIGFCRYWFDSRQVVGVEVGVARGLNSVNILSSLNMKELFLVDPYKEFYTFDGTVRNFSHMKKSAMGRLGGFTNATFVFKDSKEVVGNDFAGKTFDFVYLDGCHCYPDVLNDLKSLYPLVNRDYGVFGGHDYGIVDVRRAVGDFFMNKNLYVFTRGDDWWVVNCRRKN